MNNEQQHLIELEFVPVQNRTYEKAGERLTEITGRLMNWDYVPSIPCIQQVFKTSWATAKQSQINTVTNKRAWKTFIDARIEKIRNWRANNRARAMFEKHFMPSRGVRYALRDKRNMWNW